MSTCRLWLALLLLPTLLSCTDNVPFLVAPPLLIVGDQWGPLLRGVSPLLQPQRERPQVINVGDPPSLVGGCTISPRLPDGLLFFSIGGTCLLSGTPTTLAGETEYTITVSNVAGADTAKVRFAVVQSPPFFVAATDTVVYNGFYEIVNLSGETLDSCRLSATSPPLPPGVSLANEIEFEILGVGSVQGRACVIFGAPTAAPDESVQTYTIIATNVAGSLEYDVEIEFALLPPDLSVDVSTHSLTTGEEFTIQIANRGSPLRSCASTSPLPGGVTVSVNSEAGGCVVSGAPTMPSEPAIYSIMAVNEIGVDTLRLVIEVREPDNSDGP